MSSAVTSSPKYKKYKRNTGAARRRFRLTAMPSSLATETETGRAPRVHITTLGCPKNQVDTDKVTAMLAGSGYRTGADLETADVVMINTCAFIEAARQESVETILDAHAGKADSARLVVMGCMAQRYGAELEEALAGEADAVVGLDRYGEMVGLLDEMTDWTPVRLGPRRPKMDILEMTNRPAPALPYAYVKIAEGCDKTCAFCAIPLIRGPQRSRRPIDIRNEIAALGEGGASEIVLVAQDLAAYGRDVTAPSRTGDNIVDLLRFISDAEGLRRLRLLYLYPTEIRPALIEEMAANPVIAPYFDLSLQHASRRLLRAMRRPGSFDSHLKLIGRIREAAPDAALRSSFIVGYPGETGADVDELADFLTEARLDWAGFFPYSPESGTDAVAMEDKADSRETAARIRELSAVQDRITAERNAAEVGRIREVLVDQVEDGTPVGRSHRQAPDIDGLICLDRGRPGEWVRAEITGSYETDQAARALSVIRPAAGRAPRLRDAVAAGRQAREVAG